MQDIYQKIQDAVKKHEKDIIEFARALIMTPSTSGDEKNLADLCLRKMQELGYDEVFRDHIGNVVGIIKGSGGGPTVMYNSHMDHVDPGARENWEFEPYGAEVKDGYIHGRAASDVKGGMASQIYALAILKEIGAPLGGNLIYTGVVQEEPAEMFGMKYLCDVTFKSRGINFDVMISSEATSMNLYLGHRGRVEIEVVTKGRTSHGSAPWRGVNAVYKMVPVIQEVQALYDTLPEHEFLGKSTIALTIISCSPGRLSIIPDQCSISLDRRLVPGETDVGAVQEIQKVLDKLAAKDPDFKAEVRIREVTEMSYTGISSTVKKSMPPWVVDKDHPFVKTCVDALAKVGQKPGFGKWDFATDASYVTGVLGIPSIGYSPMEEQYAHTPYDRVRIDYLIKSVAGNAAIGYDLSNKKS
ncbi:MAG TPA: YgeY family selenium metabolism-linked hydrolase [Clostridia bacterium]|nr:YgeY family selenium metabolism-linked hydrolase [Clostridia bacterium]